MTFGEKLQKLRKARNLSQEELAAQLSVTRQTISKWELDQSTPELGLLAQISDIFGVTTDYLIKETVGEATEPTAEKPTAEKPTVKKPSARLALCIVLLCLGVIGWITFLTLSKLHPWGFITDKHEYEGLLGYLLGSKTLFLFVLCVLSALAGLGGLVYMSVQEKKNK